MNPNQATAADLRNLRRTWRVAVASSDALTVNEHFGHAKRFLVYDVRSNGYAFVDERTNEPSGGPTERDESHLRALDRISDCQLLVVASIGPGALKHVLARGLTCHTTEESINRILNHVARRLGATTDNHIVRKG